MMTTKTMSKLDKWFFLLSKILLIPTIILIAFWIFFPIMPLYISIIVLFGVELLLNLASYFVKEIETFVAEDDE